jgi:CO/xanthine dehydrogenase Mo-binding subunit
MLTWNPHREGPYGAKGIGEQGVAAFPPAVSNAVHNAVGVRISDLVISREKLLNAIRRG